MYDLDADWLLKRNSMEMNDAVNVIEVLHSKGYEENFELVDGLIRCCSNKQYYKVRDFFVDEIYRFSDDSGVLNGTYIYAVRETWNSVKGIFIIHLPGGKSMTLFTTP